MKNIIISIILLLLIQSCFIVRKSISKEMNSHLNKNSYNLILSYGQPIRKDIDGNGGQIWIWAYNIYNAGYTIYGGQNIYVPPQNYWRYKMFYIGANDIVYHWLYKTEQIPPQRIDMTVYQHIKIN